MAQRRNWSPKAFHFVESTSSVKQAILLAQLGELFYKEICSRELQKSDTSSIATRSEKLHRHSERKVANE